MKVVKIMSDEDGTKKFDPKWCAIDPFNDAERTLCTGEVFGKGEGSAVYKTKEGRVTCSRCISKIKYLSKYLKLGYGNV